jgi:hypothetical protein
LLTPNVMSNGQRRLRQSYVHVCLRACIFFFSTRNISGNVILPAKNGFE